MHALPKVIFEATRFAILVHLLEYGGRSHSLVIRDALGNCDRARLNLHKRKLKRAGLVVDDGRAVILTDEGRNALAAIGEAISATRARRKVAA
jgi:hypothetical protein